MHVNETVLKILQGILCILYFCRIVIKWMSINIFLKGSLLIIKNQHCPCKF